MTLEELGKRLDGFEREVFVQADSISILAGQMVELITAVQTVLALQQKMMVEQGYTQKSIDEFCSIQGKAFHAYAHAMLSKEIESVGLTVRKLGEPPTPPGVPPLN